MTTDLEPYDALVARSISVIDSLDDIDDMAPIGAVLDALVFTLDDYRDRRAVLAVRGRLMAADFAATFDEHLRDPDRGDALATRYDCTTDMVERLWTMTTERYVALARQAATSIEALAALENALAATANDLRTLIAGHDHVATVPDTIPESWT